MDKNTARLDLKLPLKLKKAAFQKAKKERRKVSDYIRILIEKDVAAVHSKQ
jgi:hypothetical protein